MCLDETLDHHDHDHDHLHDHGRSVRGRVGRRRVAHAPCGSSLGMIPAAVAPP
ncbi:MAG: hypothetical protein ACRD2C_19180 [Acidimicrobiales bacterium]